MLKHKLYLLVRRADGDCLPTPFV